MRVVYRYIDKKDGLVKYIGIVTSDKRTLSQRVKEHTSDSWYDNGDWLIEYFTEGLDTKGECESWEGHLIAKYKTYEWYNKAKSNWGLNKNLPEEPEWKGYIEGKDISIDSSFYWLNIESEIFHRLKSATLSRFIMLLTYADSKNRIVFDRTKKRGDKYMKLSDIQDVMGLSERTFFRFWSEIKEQGFVYERDGVCYIKKGIIFYRYDDISRHNLMKLYKNNVRRLYLNSATSLYYLYRLIPLTNKHYNIICNNASEENLTRVQPLTIAETCEAIGVDSTNQSKFISHLNSLVCIDKTQKRYPAVIRSRNYIIVNPRIYNYFISNVNLVKLLAIDSGEFNISDLENAL